MKRTTSRCGPRGRGVSPVIGVVLMVAIVVVLAAVAGAYLTTFADAGEESSPSFGANVDYDRSTDGDGQSITITHKKGDNINVSTLSITVSGAEAVDPSNGTRADVEYTGNVLSSVGSELRASDSLTLDGTHFEKSGGGSIKPKEYLDLSEATVRIVWEDGPERSGIVFVWEGETAG
ncbi:MAG: type IV pilin [Halapricum sp.]